MMMSILFQGEKIRKIREPNQNEQEAREQKGTGNKRTGKSGNLGQKPLFDNNGPTRDTLEYMTTSGRKDRCYMCCFAPHRTRL